MEYSKLNDNKLTVLADLSVGSLGKQRRGSRGLSNDSIAKILLSCSELSADWLITGRGDMLRKDRPYQEASPPLDVVTEAGKKSTQQLCLLCQEKDKVIAAQQSQIDTQAEYIALLKEQSPQINGQKRKLP